MNKRLVYPVLFLAICFCIDPDPYGCDKRGPLVVADAELENGHLHRDYCEKISGTEGFAESRLVDSSQLPAGLAVIDSTGLYIKGIPVETGSFKIPIQVSEFGTQCAGRTAYFYAILNIEE
jgi:hypothetical protein